MNRRGKQQGVERDLLKRASRLGPQGPDRALEDELLAALVDGTESLDGADTATLARVLEREGTEFVAELLARPPRPEDAARRPFEHLRGTGPRPSALPVPLRMAAAAVGMLGAGLLAFVLSWSSGRAADGWLRPDGMLVTGRPFPAAGTLGGAGTRWGAELRGALDAELAPRLVLIAASSESPFGCGAQLDDGWIVTASSVVESAVRNASWTGEAARVEVRTTMTSAAPFGRLRTATVHRHRPERGLSLLRLDDGGGDASLPPLPIAEPADGAEVLWLVASPGLEAPVGEGATWVAGGAVRGAAWARQRPDSATLRPLAARFEPGAPGSPVILDSSAGPALAGILVDARGESGRVVGPADLRALLETEAEGLAPELRPIDPWSLSPGEAMFQVRAPAFADWVGRVDSDTDPRIVLFQAAGDVSEGALPRDGFAADAGTTFPVELFVILREDGRLAVGVCNDAGEVTRVWGGERSSPLAQWTWSRDAEGSWRRETSTRGIPFANPAWLSGEQVRWLEGALGR